jgi:hypothetical protein
MESHHPPPCIHRGFERRISPMRADDKGGFIRVDPRDPRCFARRFMAGHARAGSSAASVPSITNHESRIKALLGYAVKRSTKGAERD